jgi:hypothetical protein
MSAWGETRWNESSIKPSIQQDNHRTIALRRKSIYMRYDSKGLRYPITRFCYVSERFR